MCVTSVHAGTIKRPVSNLITKEGWVYIPIDASFNDTWIPIPSKIMDKINVTALRQHFQLVYMQSNGVLRNDSLYPSQDEATPALPAPFIGYVSALGLLLMIAIGCVIIKLMQSEQCKSRH